MLDGTDHASLMNSVYKRQRLIYDATRKFFLFGRDDLIDRLAAEPGAKVLEVACGTGRNLARIGKRWPSVTRYGFDISSEMLTSARAKLGDEVKLAEADACDFDPEALFGVSGFDRIAISYAISMIPDWQGAIREAIRHLAPGGEVHIVDFGTQARLPGVVKRVLRHWLGGFHVTPRDDLDEVLATIAAETGTEIETASLYRDYARRAVIRRPL